MRRRTCSLALAALFVTACTKEGRSPSPPPGMAPRAISVTSTDLAPDAPVPARFTCDGNDAFPELAWSPPPAGTAALVLVVDDPDAPGGVFTHLVAWDARPDAREIAQGASPRAIGAVLGKNDFGKLGWGGPCPPRGALHHYRFRVIALDKPLGLPEGASRADLDAALSGHVLGEGTLVGTYRH